jgi:RNA polymerase sigma-70 factor (ECF subfamily)
MNGTTADLEALYTDAHGQLQRLLMRNGLSRAEAADLVQDAFLRLLGAPMAEVRDLRSYLFRTTKNLFVDSLRSRRKAILHDAAPLDEDIVDPALQPDAALISSQELTQLLKALDALPPRSREVLILHKFEGLSYVDIAARLGIAKNTVMVHMVKALGCLRAQFAGQPRVA